MSIMMHFARKRTPSKEPKQGGDIRSPPLSEGLLPLNAHGHTDWQSLSDDMLLTHAEGLIEEKGLRNRTALQKERPGLYKALKRRELLDRIDFEEARERWGSMSDRELIAYARQFIDVNGIRNMTRLRENNMRLYAALARRGLREDVGLGRMHRDWAASSDVDVVEYAEKTIKEAGIRSKTELQIKDGGLYVVLSKRGLLGEIEFGKKLKNWAALSDDSLIAIASRSIEEHRIRNRTQFADMFGGLCNALRKRGILGKIGFEKVKPEWFKLRNEEIVDIARSIVGERRFSRTELSNEERGLYESLRRRGLLDEVFAPFEESKGKESVRQVMDALLEF